MEDITKVTEVPTVVLTKVSSPQAMNTEHPEEAQQIAKKKDYFKQKVALFFGYNGKAYKGLQKQKYLLF